jgi:hypothetical protein
MSSKISRIPLILGAINTYLVSGPFLNSYQAYSDFERLSENLHIYEMLTQPSASLLEETRQHYRQEIFGCIASSQLEGDLKYYQIMIPGYYHFCSPEQFDLEEHLPKSLEWYLNTSPTINDRYEDV